MTSGIDTRGLTNKPGPIRLPDVEIESLDFKSAMNEKLAPFLVALKAE